MAKARYCRSVRVAFNVSLVTHPTGPELRAARMTAGLPVSALADALGVSVSRVRGLESQRGLRPETAQRYVSALHDAWSAREREALAEARADLSGPVRDPRDLVRELVSAT